MKTQAARQADKDKLDHAYDELEQHAPDRVARAIRWLRDPKGKWVRLPLGLLIIAANLFGPLVPFLGIEFVPLGLLLIAQDVPPLRKPVATMTLWLERKWMDWRQRRQQRRQAHR
ncbi:MAG TPA: hypothetical protein VEA40_01685 [Ramlibacter sp.]|nr:hypothetical protein [Ramlibacter sp.]